MAGLVPAIHDLFQFAGRVAKGATRLFFTPMADYASLARPLAGEKCEIAGPQMSSSTETSLTDLGVVVRCFTPIGTIPGMGKIEIDAREFISLESHHVQQFLGLQVTAGGEYAQTATALIPYESIDRLVAAIDRLSDINPSSTKYKQIEVEFAVAPDFKLIVFTDAKGKVMFSVSAQSATAYFGDLLKMSDLKSYVQRAKRTIDENRPREADQNLPAIG